MVKDEKIMSSEKNKDKNLNKAVIAERERRE